jgi:mannose-6-phosphate isomerase-like protein (cupin superfamily)
MPAGFMRRTRRAAIAAILSMIVSAPHALAQTPADQSKPADPTKAVFMSASDAAAAVAANAAKQGTNPNALTTIFKLGPYTLYIEHRNPVKQVAAIHDKEAELFYVLDGAATLITGGTIIAPVQRADDQIGTGIEGGTPQRMTKGDFLLIPHGVPHQITDIQGSFTPLTLHLPMVR